MRAWALLFLVPLFGCVTTPKTCVEQADEAYRRCVNPYVISTNQQADPVRSDEAQGCRTSHQQALNRCGVGSGPQPPVIDLRPDAGPAPEPEPESSP